jgi:CelD/BcsL family acetyltransferase involved in cellulose biosynthesis
MHLTVIDKREDLGGIGPVWDELAQFDRRDGFFRTSVWYRAWMEHIRPDAQPFVIVARNGAGRIIGVAPLCRLKYRDLGFQFDAIAWGGREVVSGDFLDFVSEPESRAGVASAIFDLLWRKRSDWDMLVMGELIAGGATRGALEQLSAERGFPVRSQEERLCPYISLPGGFDEYLNTLGSSTRYHIRRRMRDVEKRGGRVDIHVQPGEILSRLDTMIRLHRARWQRDGQPGTLGRPGFAAFLRQICAAPQSGFGVRLYMLTYREAPVAALLTFYFGESALYYQAGWDPASPLASLSPGVVVMARSIRDAIENGCRYYEFLRGNEAYKSRWTSQYRETSTLLAAQGLIARQYLRVAGWKDRWKEHVLRRSANHGAISVVTEEGENNATL